VFFSVGGRKIGENAKLRHPPRRRKKALRAEIWTATVFSRTTTAKGGGGGGSTTELTKATGRV